MRRASVLILLLAAGCRGKRSEAPVQVAPASLLSSVPKPLLAPRVTVAAGENGWTDALKAATPPADPTAGWSELLGSDLSRPERLASAQRAVRALEPRLTLLHAALRKPVWSAPPDSPEALTIERYGEFWHLAQALILRGELRIAQGDARAGATDLLAVRTLGTRIGDSGGAVVAYLCGNAIRGAGDRALQRAAWNSRMTPAVLRELLTRSVLEGAATDPALGRAFMVEFQTTFVADLAKRSGPVVDRDSDDLASQVLRGHPDPFDREATIRLAAEGLSDAVENAAASWSDQKDLDRLGVSWTEGFKIEADDPPSEAQIAVYRSAAAKVKNPFGRYLAAKALVPDASVLRASFQARTEDSATRAVLLLALWVKEHGGALPKDLPSPVRDPFSGESLLYDPERAILWSVGTDKEDNGGAGMPGRFRPGEDEVWPVKGLFSITDRDVRPPVPGV